tara:strand:- start:5638 stop:5865 length:228 start_codon:yes stop_codon:yes gene_type:complete
VIDEGAVRTLQKLFEQRIFGPCCLELSFQPDNQWQQFACFDLALSPHNGGEPVEVDFALLNGSSLRPCREHPETL